MNRGLTTIVLCLIASTIPNFALAQFNASAKDAPAIAKRDAGETIQTMLLGVYHFDNPGADELNSEVDDYFADKRQAEIADVVVKLAKFKPTKIFVEATPNYQELMDKRYQAFAKGELDLKDLKGGRNEIYQLGFRIAKACGLSGVHCVDSPGVWLGGNLKETAAQQMPEFFDAVHQEMSQLVEQENKRLLANTIGENLIEMNTRESIMRNHSYYNQIATLVADPNKTSKLLFDTKEQDGNEYMMIGVEQHNIGAELVGKWYTRNIKTFSNIIRSLEEDDERILVIFGQGHIRPIEHFCEDHPILVLVNPIDYLNGDQ